jgi:hypothetical protein
LDYIGVDLKLEHRSKPVTQTPKPQTTIPEQVQQTPKPRPVTQTPKPQTTVSQLHVATTASAQEPELRTSTQEEETTGARALVMLPPSKVLMLLQSKALILPPPETEITSDYRPLDQSSISLGKITMRRARWLLRLLVYSIS